MHHMFHRPGVEFNHMNLLAPSIVEVSMNIVNRVFPKVEYVADVPDVAFVCNEIEMLVKTFSNFR